MALPTSFTPGGKPRKPPIPHGYGRTHTLTIHVKKKGKPVKAAAPVDPLSRPAGPGSGYTLRQLQQMENAAAKEKFGGQQSFLQQRQQMIPAYFQAYRDQIAQAQAAQAAHAQQQVQALQSLAASAGATGPGATPEAQAAARVREANGAGQSQLAQQLGGIQGTFLGNLGLLTNTNQSAELSANLKAMADLAGQAGAFKQTYGQDVLANEAKARLEQAAFGLNEAKASATIQHQRRQDKIAARRVKSSNKQASRRLDIQQQNADANTYRATHPRTSSSSKDQFGNTPKDVQRNNDAWSKAKTTANFYWSHGKKSFKGDWKQLADFLVTAKNLNPLYARAAAQRIVNGAVDPKLAKQLRQRGVKVKVAKGSTQAQMITNTIQSGLQNIGQ